MTRHAVAFPSCDSSTSQNQKEKRRGMDLAAASVSRASETPVKSHLSARTNEASAARGCRARNSDLCRLIGGQELLDRPRDGARNQGEAVLDEARFDQTAIVRRRAEEPAEEAVLDAGEVVADLDE